MIANLRSLSEIFRIVTQLVIQPGAKLNSGFTCMVYHGMHHGVPWYTMVYHGIPLCTMIYHGILWYTMVYHGILWYTMVYHGTSRYTMVYHVIPWYTYYTMVQIVYHGENGGP